MVTWLNRDFIDQPLNGQYKVLEDTVHGMDPLRINHFGTGFDVMMNVSPLYPVAVIGDDGVPVRFESFMELVKAIEPQDVNDYMIIDSHSKAFRIKIEIAEDSFSSRLLSLIGAPQRYMIETAKDLPDHETVLRAIFILEGSGG